MAIISADKINISGTLVRNTGGADKIVDGKEVEGGYFVCETLPSTGSYWTTGQLCYCTGDSQFYQYNGSTWEPANLGGGSSDLNIENGSGLGSVQSLGDYGTTGTSANTAVYVDENGKEVFNFNHGSNTNGVAAYKEATGDDQQLHHCFMVLQVIIHKQLVVKLLPKEGVQELKVQLQ